MKLVKSREKNSKVIPPKNYCIVLVVSILVMIITLYIRSFYLNYKASQMNNSVFNDKTISQINTDDIDFALTETSEAILYVGYTGSSKIYNMERKMLRELEKQNLTDKIIYWNVTDLMNKNEYIEILKSKFPLLSDSINRAPLLIYIKDGQGIDIISSKFTNIDYNSLNELIIKYGIE